MPQNVRRAVRGRWRLLPYRPAEPLAGQLRGSPLALVHTNGQADDAGLLDQVLGAMDRSAAVVVFLLPPRDRAPQAWEALSRRRGQFLCIPHDAAAEDLAGQLSAADQLQPVILNLQEALARARGPEVPAGGDDLTQEMHLAARLQRDFLPRRLPEVGPVRFAVLYRPAGWVSGDIYDVSRLDETHVGLYVADAVGHGLPAALLTMFIKKALQTKRIVGHSYQIVPPDASLSELNKDICQQGLSGCQFCTAVYCVLDTQNLALSYARAGHPEPILLRADGRPERLAAPGSLLGVFPEEQYECRQVALSPGDRLVLYSDGAEGALCGPKATARDFQQSLASWRHLPREEFMLHLASVLDAQAQARPEDDVTVVIADVAP